MSCCCRAHPQLVRRNALCPLGPELPPSLNGTPPCVVGEPYLPLWEGVDPARVLQGQVPHPLARCAGRRSVRSALAEGRGTHQRHCLDGVAS